MVRSVDKEWLNEQAEGNWKDEQVFKYSNKSINQTIIHMCNPVLGTIEPFLL